MPTCGELAGRARKKLRTDIQAANYWQAYLEGLERGHDGDRLGTDAEIQSWVNADDSGGRAAGFGDGYFDGLGAEDGGGVS